MEICTVGGYEEVGKNMTAVKVGDEVFIFDMGFYLPGVIELQEDPEDQYNIRSLRRVGALPEDRILDKKGWSKKVKAIFISHAHLDHVGGVPFLMSRYPGVPIYGTPFTIEVLKSLIKDSRVAQTNPLIKISTDKKYNVKKSPNSFEFVHVTHSTLNCAFVVLHTNEGSVFYALDYKFDDFQKLEKPTNYKRLKQLGNENVRLAIIDTLYADKETSNGTEKDAREMLAQALSKVNAKKSALFVTTFSSHIERLNEIVNLATKTRREIVFLGRSLAKYVDCANKIGKCPFRNKVKVLKYKRQVSSFLRKLNKNRERYFVVCTGHQGEKNSILDRLVNGKTDFHFNPGDNLIFSSSVIPTEVNIKSRQELDNKLKILGVNIQVNVHVHGHGSAEDKKKLMELVKPKHVLPSHGSLEQEKPLIELSKKFGYEFSKTSHLSKNGEILKI